MSFTAAGTFAAAHWPCVSLQSARFPASFAIASSIKRVGPPPCSHCGAVDQNSDFLNAVAPTWSKIHILFFFAQPRVG